MRRSTVAAVAALCVIGTGSLTLADEGARYGDQIETGKLSQEPSVLGSKREPVRANDAVKREKGAKPTSSDEGTRYADQIETGTLSEEPSVLGKKRKPVQAHDSMKGEKMEQKEKTKAHKNAPNTAPAAPAPAP